LGDGSSCHITFSVPYNQDKPRQEHLFDLYSNCLRWSFLSMTVLLSSKMKSCQ
jgi:hypothetical protein